jgi:hypothetical protein
MNLFQMKNSVLKFDTLGVMLLFISSFVYSQLALAAEDLDSAVRRASYLLTGQFPTEEEIQASAVNGATYRSSVDQMLNGGAFYDVMLRYHERLFGVGLQDEYLDELQLDSLDSHSQKLATISCERTSGQNSRFRCAWASDSRRSGTGGCSPAQEVPARAFWYPGVVAWACPSVLATCGGDLSHCFIDYFNNNAAKSSELGATEIFDSQTAIVKSLSKQSAGIAAAVVAGGYPYTKILEPGLTAVDGAVAHLYKQRAHFDLSKLNISERTMGIVENMKLNHTRFQLIYTRSSDQYEQAGVLSSFGWLRRYEKNRTRANQLYNRLLCRKFTAELPRVFPQDPGNLRTTPGCMGCHSTLDPLADFFTMWGEGGELYNGTKTGVTSTFAGRTGSSLSDLADIIRSDNAFGTCAVESAWEWLMGREFYHNEANLRAAFTSYFVTTNYNFKELVFAIATHPAFTQKERSDGNVTDPLSDPPLGEPPGGVEARPCTTTISFVADIQPHIGMCTTCHAASSTTLTSLATESQWSIFGLTAVGLMASGSMPPGQAGPPLIGSVYDLKEKVRCWKEQNP